jgi:UDP-N-acetylmuramoylalanine--D-glutamate ligase
MNGRNLHHTKVSVIGAARSGVGAALLLQTQGAKVFVSDIQPGENLTQSLLELERHAIPFEVGGHTERVYDCSLMVLSPGVPDNAPVVQEALRRGIDVVSELEVASWYCPGRIVAITGTNGKTTTTTLVGRILDDAKKKHVVAGNIGQAFSNVVSELDQTSVAVLEVSSFQLDHCISFHPSVAVILNITSDHLDRYDNSMDRYAASKARIFMNQTSSDALIFNADDEWTSKTVRAAQSSLYGFSAEQHYAAFIEKGVLVTTIASRRTEIIPVEEMSIKGIHNRYNAMAATLVGLLLGVSPASLRATLRNFKGVEHRLEEVRELNGVKYVNDSKATNVESVWYALQAFHEPIVLLLGGREKGNDYSKLNDLVRERVRAIVAIGESAPRVEAAFGSLKPVVVAFSMEEAVRTARELANPGDVVLLSPGCKSFDWFENFEHRGRVFKQLVNAL